MVMNHVADLTPKSRVRRDYGLILAKAAQATGCCAMALLLVMATASRVEAQEVASSLDQLRVLVKPKDTVTVTDAAGQQIRGTIAALSPASLELVFDGKRRTFLDSDITTIRQRRSDSLKNGALWGLGVGVGLGGLCTLAVLSESGEYGLIPLCALVYGGMGAAIGVGVDAMIRGTQVIYSKSTGSSARLTLSPVIARERKAVLVLVGF